jgi:dihydrofolate reductase
MRKVVSFMVVTLDGYYEGPNGEFDWPNVDDEFNEFAVSQINDIDILLFGRATYVTMASFWPTPEAVTGDPIVAGLMNGIAKVVFSRSLPEATWQNTTLVRTDAVAAVADLKEQDGPGLLALFGSPTLTTSLIEAGLIDELRVMIHPILLGDGTSLFATLTRRQPVKLLRSQVFSSGNVLLTYQPEG